MKEVAGDLWAFHARGAVVAITTNGQVQKDGTCPMPRGCARQARERFPQLPWVLGQQIIYHGNHVLDLGGRIVSFPVEHTPLETPLPSLIERSCQELVALADYKGWSQVVMPRPGCGGGGLSWDEVRPILQRHFDERFWVVDKVSCALPAQ